MSILIKSGKQYYEIPASELKKYRITRKQFEKGRKVLAAELAGQSSDCDLVDLTTCCTSKKSLWASC